MAHAAAHMSDSPAYQATLLQDATGPMGFRWFVPPRLAILDMEVEFR